MISPTDTLSSERELIQIFQNNPGTQGRTQCVTNGVKRWWHGLDSDQDLIEGHYTNGDLTMRFREAMTDATSQILNLTITDSKAGLSSDARITEKDDLIHRLRVMDIQRARAELENYDG